MKIIKETCYKGTRILFGNEKQDKIQKCRKTLKFLGFTEIQLPVINFQQNFKDKIGIENNNMMYNFTDRGNRELCLAPEYTSIIQKLADTTFRNEKNVKLFYVAECFRGEKPQKGRYRQFTQLGVEILNQNLEFNLKLLSLNLCKITNDKLKYKLNEDVNRGLDFYNNGNGFEIICDSLGSSKQVCGGGKYKNGNGFAIGIDRLI